MGRRDVMVCCQLDERVGGHGMPTGDRPGPGGRPVAFYTERRHWASAVEDVTDTLMIDYPASH